MLRVGVIDGGDQEKSQKLSNLATHITDGKRKDNLMLIHALGASLCNCRRIYNPYGKKISK